MRSPTGEARVELALALLSARPADRAVEEAERKLRAAGVRRDAASLAAGPLACLPAMEKAVVTIQTLGGFRVLREGEPVPSLAWQSKKARDLLKILAAQRGRPLPRDALMEALWPNEDPAKTANRLSVALAVVCSVLDPERRFFQEHLLAAERGRVALNLEHVELDVERFLATAEAAFALQREQAPDAGSVFEQAEAAYSGDFLPEDAYEEWSVGLREEARSAYVSVARALANMADDPEAAVRYQLRILELDRYDEEAHLGLVSALVAAGRHGDARRQHRAYAARMEEIGVEAAPFPSAPRERPRAT